MESEPEIQKIKNFESNFKQYLNDIKDSNLKHSEYLVKLE